MLQAVQQFQEEVLWGDGASQQKKLDKDWEAITAKGRSLSFIFILVIDCEWQQK